MAMRSPTTLIRSMILAALLLASSAGAAGVDLLDLTKFSLPTTAGPVEAWTVTARDGRVILFIGGPQPGVFLITPFDGQPPGPPQPPVPPNPTLTGLAADVKAWSVSLVPEVGRATEAKKLAAAYSIGAGEIDSGKTTTPEQALQRQITLNRDALGISSGQEASANRWRAVFVKVGEHFQSEIKAGRLTTMPEIKTAFLAIKQGLEAIP